MIFRPSATIWLTTETSTVMPRSLNEPVCSLPQSFTHSSSTPIPDPSREAR